jgi:hypothetical protein
MWKGCGAVKVDQHDQLGINPMNFITSIPHRIHGAAIYGNMDPINIPQMLAYIPAPWILWVLVFTIVYPG